MARPINKKQNNKSKRPTVSPAVIQELKRVAKSLAKSGDISRELLEEKLITAQSVIALMAEHPDFKKNTPELIKYTLISIEYMFNGLASVKKAGASMDNQQILLTLTKSMFNLSDIILNKYNDLQSIKQNRHKDEPPN